MTTLPPPATKKSSKDSMESKVYSILDKYQQHLPIMNDRNRLGFNLYRYMIGEGDSPKIAVKYGKLKLVDISPEDLAKKLQEELDGISK